MKTAKTRPIRDIMDRIIGNDAEQKESEIETKQPKPVQTTILKSFESWTFPDPQSDSYKSKTFEENPFRKGITQETFDDACRYCEMRSDTSKSVSVMMNELLAQACRNGMLSNAKDGDKLYLSHIFSRFIPTLEFKLNISSRVKGERK